MDGGRPSQGRRPASEWVYPFAAAAAALIFYALTDSVERRVISATSNADLEREAAVVRMTVELGGDDVARLQAEHLMRVIESTSRLDGPAQIAASAARKSIVNEITAPSRRVRPAFMRGSAIAVALLLPILVHSVWGYIETRRLNRAIQSIQAKG